MSVLSLSTPDFLIMLSEFCSLHGKLDVMYFDRGTNFIRAAPLVAPLEERLSDGDLAEEAIKHRIKWKFQTPQAPHH
jgi:hypothetical protein